MDFIIIIDKIELGGGKRERERERKKERERERERGRGEREREGKEGARWRKGYQLTILKKTDRKRRKAYTTTI
jgi:hypothetical protein